MHATNQPEATDVPSYSIEFFCSELRRLLTRSLDQSASTRDIAEAWRGSVSESGSCRLCLSADSEAAMRLLSQRFGGDRAALIPCVLRLEITNIISYSILIPTAEYLIQKVA